MQYAHAEPSLLPVPAIWLAILPRLRPQITMAALLGCYVVARDRGLRGQPIATWHGWSSEALKGWPNYLRQVKAAGVRGSGPAARLCGCANWGRLTCWSCWKLLPASWAGVRLPRPSLAHEHQCLRSPQVRAAVRHHALRGMVDV